MEWKSQRAYQITGECRNEEWRKRCIIKGADCTGQRLRGLGIRGNGEWESVREKRVGKRGRSS